MAKTIKVKESPEINMAIEIAAAIFAGVLDKGNLKLFEKRLKRYQNLKNKKVKKHG